MTSIPNNKRVFTIESGSRELSLIRRNAKGDIINNVVHTLSRPSDNPAYDITQENLVVASLRFNPDVVCVGLEYIEGNDRARALYEKLGFVESYRKPDAIRWRDGSIHAEIGMMKYLE